MHFWSAAIGFDHLPIGHLLRTPPTSPVNDPGRYRAAVNAGRPDKRRMFTTVDGREAVWTEGKRETVDTILLATGFHPGLSYLDSIGALDATGRPLHDRGLSTTHSGLGYVELEWQRRLASASLRGICRDGEYVVKRLPLSRSAARARWRQPARA